MELLYIWIEDYKNIKRQGFNFSPLHDFEFKNLAFDKDGKVISGELIDKKTDEERKELKKVYDGFFGEDISNVTAIVGENGSGKSSVLEALFFLADDTGTAHYPKCFVSVHRINGIIYCCSSYNVSTQPNIKFESVGYAKYLYPYYFDGFSFKNSPTANVNFRDYMGDIKKHSNNSDFHIHKGLQEIRTYRAIKFLSKFQHKLDRFSFVPEELELSMFIPEINEDRLKIKIDNGFIQRIMKVNNWIKDETRLSGNQYQAFIPAWKVFVFFIRFGGELENFQNVIEELLQYAESIEGKKNDHIKPFIDCLSSFIKEKDLKFDTFYFDGIFETKLWQNLYCTKVQNFDSKREYVIKNFKLYLNELEKIVTSIESFRNSEHVPFLTLNFRYLSSGEANLLDLFSRIYDAKIISTYILLCLDEPDLGLHPQWQKELLKNLTDTLPLIFPDKQIQLIITSHSPFVVSDLPKENVLFLRKGKEDEKFENGESATGKCIVEKRTEQTFGQNIHTLFADSFFMDGGLIGEFAKGKLEKAIQWLKNTEPLTEKETDELKFIINHFGEPMIKHKLEQLYEKRFQSKIGETLENRIERLKRELAEAENIQHKNQLKS